jgi:hypothetical protein
LTEGKMILVDHGLMALLIGVVIAAIAAYLTPIR